MKHRILTALTATGLLTLAARVWADPIPEQSLGLPRDASYDGHRIDWLIQVTNYFVILLFAIMCIWMLWAVLKHNKSHKADYDHGDSKHHVGVAMSVSALIFFVVDGNLWFNSTVDVNTVYWNFDAVEKEPDVVRIEVNAHQWAWDARYAGPDGQFNTADDIVTLNDIRVPVDAPVLIQLASTDVIHSFYLPNFRVKQDAMPGMITRLTFRPKQEGEYDIGCAQHCGIHHYKMKGMLTVLSKADYDAWLHAMSERNKVGFDAEDHEAQWGWDWKTGGPSGAEKTDAAPGATATSTAPAQPAAAPEEKH